jgi:sulfur carrier protein ThiS
VEVEPVPIIVDTWLYGELARYGGEADQGSYSNLQVSLDESSTLKDLLGKLGLPTEARGITFINGDLSALPGLQPDLEHVLMDGDRVGIFHLRSMWPYQYRSGAAMIAELSAAMRSRNDQGISHSATTG